MNGGNILSKEVGADIKALETATGIKQVVKNALIRALRLGESAGNVAKQNRVMLAILLLLTLKGDAITLFRFLLKILQP